MELQQIVERYAEALSHVDKNSNIVATWRNSGSTPYQPGIQPMAEELVVRLIDTAWQTLHPNERSASLTQVAYPDPLVPATAKLDHLLSGSGHARSPGLSADEHEWGIEVKRLQFVGDNGINGDYEVAKVLSPYLKDRGMLHDALRLRQYGFTERVAIVGYGFNYSTDSIRRAQELHNTPKALATITNIRRLINRNGPLLNQPLVEFADSILRLRGWTSGPRAEADFEAWKHPAGGEGIVFGWEIRRPHLEDSYDPRHPW